MLKITERLYNRIEEAKEMVMSKNDSDRINVRMVHGIGYFLHETLYKRILRNICCTNVCKYITAKIMHDIDTNPEYYTEHFFNSLCVTVNFSANDIGFELEEYEMDIVVEKFVEGGWENVLLGEAEKLSEEDSVAGYKFSAKLPSIIEDNIKDAFVSMATEEKL